ncbi:hypothetical protein Tco_0506201 [Tanacetum coccineum]
MGKESAINQEPKSKNVQSPYVVNTEEPKQSNRAVELEDTIECNLYRIYGAWEKPTIVLNLNEDCGKTTNMQSPQSISTTPICVPIDKDCGSDFIEIEEVEFDPEGDILFLESLLYDNSSPRPPEALQANSNAIESLPPSHIPVADNDSLMEEIDLFLADDGSIPPGIESDDVDSVDDDTSISLPEFESFYVDYPNSGNSTIDVVEDIPVDVPNVLPTHPILEQDFIPTSEFFAYVVWIFLPFLAYPVIPPSLLSCGDEDTIFDPGISKVSFLIAQDWKTLSLSFKSRVSHLPSFIWESDI